MFEKNTKSDAKDIETRIVVSSDLNKYPINIPKNKKRETAIKRTIDISHKLSIILKLVK